MQNSFDLPMLYDRHEITTHSCAQQLSCLILISADFDPENTSGLVSRIHQLAFVSLAHIPHHSTSTSTPTHSHLLDTCTHLMNIDHTIYLHPCYPLPTLALLYFGL